jgi:hypothetical protein
MENTRELYIDREIHKYVDIVFGRTYFNMLSDNLKDYIQTGKIQVDYNQKDSKEFSPTYDCLYYPTVSTTKCGDVFDANDWQKLEQEIEKHIDTFLPTYELYSVRRLINEQKYFLKLIFQTILHPQEFSSNIGFEYFLNQYTFLYKNFKNETEKEELKNFTIRVIENLKNDPCVNKMGYDGKFYPLGNFATNPLEWLINKIQ